MKRLHLSVLAALFTVVMLLLDYQPVVEWPIPAERTSPQSGHAYAVQLDDLPPPPLHEVRGDTNAEQRLSTLQVLRNGMPLGPPHTVHELIFKKGAGHPAEVWVDVDPPAPGPLRSPAIEQ